MKLKSTISLVVAVATLGPCQIQSVWDDPSVMEPSKLFGPPIDIPKELHGVWKSEGYGWVLSIDERRVEFLDVSKKTCIDARDMLEEYESYFHTFTTDPENSRLGLRGKFEDYTYYFERLSSKPEQCNFSIESTPASNFDYFVDVMSTHYAFFEQRGVDWDASVAEFSPLVLPDMSDDDLWELLKNMIRPIDDGHVSLSRPHENRRQSFMPGRGRTQKSVIPLAATRGTTPGHLFGEWFDDYKSSILADILSDSGKIIARDRVIYGMAADEIGYLNVLKMGGYVEGLEWSVADFKSETDALNEALDEALTHLSAAKGLVVDTTYIGGGFDYLGREIAARFAQEPVLGSFRSPANISSVSPQPLYTMPSDRPSFDGPVVILSSNLTMSASESFIMHMKAMPQVIHIGEPSRGALSEVLSKTLPNGWSISISNEDYLDGNGVSWEGLGVPPDIYREIFNPDNIFEGHIDAVQYAVDHLLKIETPSENGGKKNGE